MLTPHTYIMMLPKTALAVAALALSPVNAIWPIPISSNLGKETLFLDQTVKVTYNGQDVSHLRRSTFASK